MMKNKLRLLYKSVRNSITIKEKSEYDGRIFVSFINSYLYRNSSTLLIYISFGSEADTLDIIKFALNDGKCVAVPYCYGNEMRFYSINSVESLVEGKFGIPTVKPDDNNIVVDFNDTVCVVPALSYDKYGNRLGYGGGYYDRYLSDKEITTVGLCYERCIHSALPAEEHDIKIDYVLTENRFKKL